MSEIECWADLPGFEGYKISTQGRVAKTNGGEPPMILVPRKHKGRMYYRCRQAGRIREVRADRAVAQAFIQQQLTGYEVRHRDRDPWNCAAKNLSVAPRRFIGQKVVKIDAAGNVLHLIPGQGLRYYEKPDYRILTNFSPFKQDAEKHPWMGWDRYHRAEAMLRGGPDDFGVPDCFAVLRAVAQEVCPTVVSMVFDVGERTVYWCENREWDAIRTFRLGEGRQK